MTTRWAALLKGVNLNGRKLPMADLKALVAGLGYRAGATLLAAGNVVFETNAEPATIAAALETALADHGLKTDIVLRDAREMAATIAANPFADAARDRPSHMLVTFHRDPVPPDALVRLGALYDGPERLAAIGRDLYIDFPDGIGESKLIGAMARAKFPRVATGRNWNTVIKLAALLDA